MSGFPSDLTPMGAEWDRWRTHEGADTWKRVETLFKFKSDGSSGVGHDRESNDLRT